MIKHILNYQEERNSLIFNQIFAIIYFSSFILTAYMSFEYHPFNNFKGLSFCMKNFF